MRKAVALFLVLCILFSLCACENVENVAASVEMSESNTLNSIEQLDASDAVHNESLIQTIYDEVGNAIKTVYLTPDGAVVGWYESEYNDIGGEIRRYLYDAAGELCAVTGFNKDGDDIGFDVIGGSWMYYLYNDEWNPLVIEEYRNHEFIWKQEYIYNDRGDQISYQHVRASGETESFDTKNYYDENGQVIRQIEANGGLITEWEYDSEWRPTKCIDYDLEETLLWWSEYSYSHSNQVRIEYFYYPDRLERTGYKLYDIDGRICYSVAYDSGGSFMSSKLYLYNIFDPSKAICLDTKQEPRVIPELMQDAPVAGVETEERPVVTSGIKKPSYEDCLDTVDGYNANGLTMYETTSYKNSDHPEREMVEEYKLMKTDPDGYIAYMTVYFADYTDENAAYNDNYSYYGWSTPRTGGVYNTYTEGWTENQEFQFYEIDSDDGYILSYLLDDVVLTVSCYPELKNDARAIMYDILTGN